jgi:short-subunit dehydrogenase
MMVVTGGSRGIGRAIVLLALQGGQRVLAIARGEEGLRRLAEEARPLNGELFTFAADLASSAGCERVIDWVKEQALPVQFLINNAGQYSPAKLLAQPDQLSELLELNLMAAHRLTRGLLHPGLEAIVNIGSVAALDFPPHMTTYTVSKYAFHGWHEAMTAELQYHPVKLHLLIPGATLTSAWDGETDLPDRILQPAQVARKVFTLLNRSTGKSLVFRP